MGVFFFIQTQLVQQAHGARVNQGAAGDGGPTGEGSPIQKQHFHVLFCQPHSQACASDPTAYDDDVKMLVHDNSFDCGDNSNLNIFD
jgi:hypothetical protein